MFIKRNKNEENNTKKEQTIGQKIGNIMVIGFGLGVIGGGIAKVIGKLGKTSGDVIKSIKK